MNNWTKIKNKILFSYMGSDWISISVDRKEAGQVKKVLEKIIQMRYSTGNIYEFYNSDTEVYFYMSSDQHFDFDPKTISNSEQWNEFLEIFKMLSKKMESEVLFRPEDSNPGENITVKIINDKVEYDFDVFKEYK